MGITPGSGTRCQAITDIIQSVASEQTALSHILIAEGEKIQKVIELSTSSEEILAVNESVRSTINAISRLEIILQSKLELFQSCLCAECE